MVKIANLLHDFMGGVHPEYNRLSARKKIEKVKPPEKAILPLKQHVGAVCEALVEVGDHIKVGQKVAGSESLSAPIIASISGEVIEIAPKMTPEGAEVKSIVIESDEKDEWEKKEPLDWRKCSEEDVIERVRETGITGLGGASFPTHVKLSPPENREIDTLIINGAECEPYVTADHQLMLEEGEKIVKGSKNYRHRPQRKRQIHSRNGHDSDRNLESKREKPPQRSAKSTENQLNTYAEDKDFIIIDGSPGIGCPVIASIKGGGQDSDCYGAYDLGPSRSQVGARDREALRDRCFGLHKQVRY